METRWHRTDSLQTLGRCSNQKISDAGRIGKLVAVVLAAVLTLLTAASAAFAQDQARRLVALLDYLGGDYQNAVQDGKIANPDEYAEMQDFSKRILELIGQLKAVDKADKAGVEIDLKIPGKSGGKKGRR